ncbi:Dehydrogenase/reductase SDR family member 4 [Geodia barretti]|uniref:Dehydrogenase/reductase SDR family member 4 n=1 Tax=Geodia barretti TaxID=519541 RepID=A0AA35WH96_GEOBA|nr:Dehydrogenase/reductase SDR family member 4 [Geodia barretti]
MTRKRLSPVTIAAIAVLSAASSLAPPTPTLAQDAPPRFSDDLFGSLRYRYVGPSRGGRVTAVAGHRAHPSTFYMGATGGGVWKTTDRGHNWRNISDGYFGTGSIGAIRVADSDPNIVYVSTGSDGIRSNVIIGDGVYKSTDAGETWQHLGLELTGNSGAVLIHPDNPDLVYVAAIGNPFAPNPDRGVYRSRDGGANWENVLFVSDSTGAVDLEFAPDDPNTVYASMWRGERKPWTIISGGLEGGIYISRDGGDTWSQATDGLPTGLRGQAPPDTGGVYRSDDRGATWRQVTDFQPILNRPFYYMNLEGHPTDPDILWGMAEGHWMSTDGGRSWQPRSTPHGDNHDLWINPDNPDIMVQSNDGGANVSIDGGQTWSTQLNQPTAELYQDNSTISVPSLPERSEPGGPQSAWESHGGCETGPVVPKPGDPDIVYANCKGRFGLYNRRTGQEQHYYVGMANLYGHNPKDLEYRFQRVVPIHVSPHDPNKVYHGSQFVHVTTNGGQRWETISPDLTAFTPETQVVSGHPITLDVTGEEHFSVLYDIQESVLEPGVIWAGANDGPVHVTRDGGANWDDVTPPGIGPYGRVQTIEVSHHDPAKAYVAILRYQLGDFAPYTYRTEDYGATWTRITTGENGGLLYLGTEFGMFISFDDGGTWQPFQLNLPVTPVTDMKVVHGDLVLSTMGRGFWIMDNLTPLHELDDRVASASAHLYEIRDVHRLRYGGGFGGRGGVRPSYPQAGAQIDYVLSDAVTGPLTLDIVDAEGVLVRSISNQGPGEYTVPAEPGMREWRLERFGTPRLPDGAGTHRFTWDLSHPGPWAPNPGRSGRGGPMVPPGTYTARLSAGDWSASRTFEVMLDPRVAAEGIDEGLVRRQVDFALEVRDALSEARLAVHRIEEARERGGGELASEIEAVEKELVSEPRRYSRPMLVDQLQYLRGAIPMMRERGGGAIVFVSSVFGREKGGPGLSIYNTTKSALISAAGIMALELAKDGIRVNCVAPGSIRFEGGSWDKRVKADPDGMRAFVQANLPLGRFGRAGEVGDVVAFLASERASLITGACIAVDGAQGKSLV